MLRTPFASERIQRIDPQTGIKVIQLTSYPTPSAHLLYDWPCITPDNRHVVLFCQRAARRDAPWDLFRVDADGLNLFQLTEHQEHAEKGGYYGRPEVRLTLDGKTVYGVWSYVLCGVDVETGRVDEILSLEKHCPKGSVIGQLHLTADGARLFVSFCGPDGYGLLRVHLDSGKVADVTLPGSGYLFACDPTGPRLVVTKGKVVWDTLTRADGSRVITNRGDIPDKWLTDEDGKEIEYFCPEMFAHATLLGRRLTVQGCGKPPHHCIWLVEKGQEPTKLAQGPYFWHSGASWNAEWIAADTNWPDRGLQLIHVPTGHFATLCHAGATQEHYEFGHPHPTLSQDGSLCVFRSDRSGMAQIYIAHVSREFQERVIAGDLKGDDKWMP